MTQVYFTKKRMLIRKRGIKRIKNRLVEQQDFILLEFGEEGVKQDRIRV